MTILDAARDTLALGIYPVPITPRTKRPSISGWQNSRLSIDDLSEHFSYGNNLGWLLGIKPRPIADLDFDCPEALAVAPLIAGPKTDRIFGRKSTPSAHRLYELTEEFERVPFEDPVLKEKAPREKRMLIELRGRGGQTVVPPSIHESGERIEWEREGAFGKTTFVTLRNWTAKIAAAALLIRYWPRGHETRHALAGMLAREAWTEEATAEFVCAVMRIAQPDNHEARADVRNTFVRMERGEGVSGRPRLEERFDGNGTLIVTAIAEWLGLGPAGGSRVIVLRRGETPKVVDEAEAALLEHTERIGVFQRAGELVRVTRLPEPRRSAGLKRPGGIVILEPLSPVALMEIFERIVVFNRFNKSDKPRRVDCPPRLAATYLARTGEWRLPVLAGVISAPLLRDDGTILTQPGFDEKTGLYFVTDERWPQIPEQPTAADVEQALETLLASFAEFPFVDQADRAVHVAAILTAIQRRLLEACPLFAYSAPAQRSGKSLLAESVAVIATGKPAPATGVSPQREELRKAVTAALREGHSVINLDNIDGVLASPDLARAITQIEYSDRLLGETKMLRLPTNALWTATGNNLTVRGDLTSRTLLSRIDAGVERPEERKFKIPDLVRHLNENRKNLVAAALTILKAYHVAGRPRQNVPAWGGFNNWSASIREALVWAGLSDPCLTRETVLTEDPEREESIVVLLALSEAFADSAFTVKEVIDRCEADVALKNVMLGVAARRDAKNQLDPKRVGWFCRQSRDRVIAGHRLRRSGNTSSKIAHWQVQLMGGGHGDQGGHSDPTANTSSTSENAQCTKNESRQSENDPDIPYDLDEEIV